MQNEVQNGFGGLTKTLMFSGRNGRIRTCDPLTPSPDDCGQIPNNFNHNQTLRFALWGIKALEGIAVNSGEAK